MERWLRWEVTTPFVDYMKQMGRSEQRCIDWSVDLRMDLRLSNHTTPRIHRILSVEVEVRNAAPEEKAVVDGMPTVVVAVVGIDIAVAGVFDGVNNGAVVETFDIVNIVVVVEVDIVRIDVVVVVVVAVVDRLDTKAESETAADEGKLRHCYSDYSVASRSCCEAESVVAPPLGVTKSTLPLSPSVCLSITVSLSRRPNG